jgi:hypothetical protein
MPNSLSGRYLWLCTEWQGASLARKIAQPGPRRLSGFSSLQRTAMLRHHAGHETEPLHKSHFIPLLRDHDPRRCESGA